MPERGWRSSWRIAVGCGALIALVLAIYVGVRLANNDSRKPSLSAGELRQLIRDKNLALGHLENQKLEEAEAALEGIASKLPDDPLPWQNLAVLRVLALGEERGAPPPGALEAANNALNDLVSRAGETTSYHWLALRAAMAGENAAGAESQVAMLVKSEPENAAAWYAKFEALRLNEAKDLDPQALQALEQACSLRPENAWLRVEWLRALGTQLTRAEEGGGQKQAPSVRDRYGDIAGQLGLARSTIEPFSPIIKTHARADVLTLTDEAIQAINGNDLRLAGQRMLTIANVLVPHAAPDQRLVRMHPLALVATEFQPEVLQALPPAAGEAAIEVAFQRQGELPMKAAGTLDVELADFDLDGRLDFVVLLPGKVEVWSRGPAGEQWKSIAFAEVADMDRLLVQDLDADFDETANAVHGAGDGNSPKVGSPALRNGCPSADVDVIAFGEAGVALLENRFDRKARERTLEVVADDKQPAALQNVTAATVADLEADGDLDLVLAANGELHRWINIGDWGFTSSTTEARPNVAQLLALDFDRDVDIDILVASPEGAGWLENVRHGQFRWRGFAGEFPDLASARSLEVLDADGNASWDVVAVTNEGLRLVTTLTPQSGDLRQKGSDLLSDSDAESLQAWDYDNDGRDDLLMSSKTGTTVWHGRGPNNSESSGWSIDEPEFSALKDLRGASFGDVDSDGDLDVAGIDEQGVALVTNEGGNQNHWIDVALQAQQIKGQQHAPSGRVSPFGVGCLLELKSGPQYQAKIVRGQSTHFGIGQAKEADVIRVLWLNGVPQNLIRPAADLFLCEQQVLNTSCPYLYAWNGKQFEFVTDLLWNAPLGLQLAEGVLAPPRDWEYVKIPGESLAAKDGHYVLQITEELWEAVYFDEVKLIAVDHPAEVEIYSNEKVGPPALAEHKIHTVRQPRTPIAGRNQAGRDLLPALARADGVYAQIHERKLRQGVVEECFLELDLGDVRGARQITLFLTGWVYPSSTSINVALSQGGLVLPPKPPSLFVPDGNGEWKEALPFMGFPGGKTKTMAVDLSGLLLEGDPRVRIATSMEFYWDQVFFTVNEQTAEIETTELELVSADLHERGFSRVLPDPRNGPERFLYGDVSRAPKWPSMQGAFTRLGDVKSLVEASDDRLLVMGAGDEMTLRFRVSEKPLPSGWKRDFLLYSVGWEKDCNLLTVLGDAVEPLPFRSMTAYPWPAGEPIPQAADYQDYLRTYQTRRQTSGFWHAIRRFP